MYLPCGAGIMDGRVVMDGPGTPNDPMLDLLCGVVSCARRNVTVLIPYFLPPRELVSALVSAASRGVDVRVILPGTLDHAYVEWASNHAIPPLLESGVRIFRQPGRLNFEMNVEVPA